ncbi:acyltransferase family protein [Catellatospora sp. NPDC049133]|jgi:cellulose synthase/poly-beta-1,6-N-acetylglucosamine synthase-like glycosyltransferase/peptidoglycan/LPS O-acetylase OafA/YrhL|uniref:acyltransferase family protein n=1 Tax=Catellatospora sp. NPDC049133 TaxID=3155499 RepID=UPI0033EFA7DB
MRADNRWARLVAALVCVAVIVAYVEFVGTDSAERVLSLVVLLYSLGILLAGLLRRHRDLPLPSGRIIAVVPAYNEDPEMLHDTVRSLLNGTVVPDVIHVVDDGSASELPPFQHARVIWHKRENGGKHHAQATALLAELADFDFVVTVDSDSVVDRHAVERCLRRFADPKIQGVTGVVYAMNRAENLITKVTDLHYLHSCLVIRDGLSATGDIFTASGALAVWRSAVVMDNLTEYLRRGVADDRHLTHFAQRRGTTAAVADAIVHTAVPDNAPDLFRQRIRWARDYYRVTALDIRYLTGWSFWLRTFDFALMCLAPIFILGALMVFPFAQWRVPWVGVGLWVAFLYAQTTVYLFDRRGVPLAERLSTWLLLTPALYVFQLVVVGPAVLAGLANLRHKSWQTRNEAKEAAKPKTAEPAPQPRQGRSFFLDLLRALAMARVIAFHATGFVWLGFALPSMGVMFALAGSLMARSMMKAKDRPEIAVWSRFRRVMPAVWAAGLILVPLMWVMGWDGTDARPFNETAVLAWVFPLSDPPGNDWAVPITGVLWYIRTYLWLTLLAPLLWACYRRRPLLTALAPLALLAVSPLIGFSSWLADVTQMLGIYAPCWVLGYWHATGRLQRANRKLVLALSVVMVGGALGWLHFFPPAGGLLQASPVGQVLWCAAFVVPLLHWDPELTWLSARRRFRRVVEWISSRSLTMFLWHQLAVLTTIFILGKARIWALDNEPLLIAIKLALSCVFVAGACWLLGWVEDLPRRRRRAHARVGRHHPEVVAVIAPPPEPDQTMVMSTITARTIRATAPVP